MYYDTIGLVYKEPFPFVRTHLKQFGTQMSLFFVSYLFFCTPTMYFISYVFIVSCHDVCLFQAQAQQAQTIAEQQHQAAAALELSNAAAAPAQNTNAMNIRRPFDPTAHELDANFRLTRFADLKG